MSDCLLCARRRGFAVSLIAAAALAAHRGSVRTVRCGHDFDKRTVPCSTTAWRSMAGRAPVGERHLRLVLLSGAAAVEPPEAVAGQGQGEGQEHPGLGPLERPVVAGGLVAFG